MNTSFIGEATVQDALSALLDALGLSQMAIDVKTETEPERLRKYARVIAKHTPESHNRAVCLRLRDLGLL